MSFGTGCCTCGGYASVEGVPLQGPPGPGSSGFGAIDYTDLNAGTPLDVPGGVWTRLIRNLQPSGANPNPPRGPWADFAFWDSGLLRAKAVGDIYLFKFSFTVIPSQRDSSIRFAVRPGGNSSFDFGPGAIRLEADAGQAESSSATFSQTVRSRFAAQGAEVHVTSLAGATLVRFSPEITPLGYVPA